MSEIKAIIDQYKQFRDQPEEIAKIEEAYRLASEQHEGQKRKTLHPFIVHPLSVALILAEMELDWEVICAALLHDTIEDTALTPDIVLEKFGRGVLNLVDSLTKIRKAYHEIGEKDNERVEIESIRKIILGTTHDWRVILIKLADRWDNVKTLSALPPKRAKRIAEEPWRYMRRSPIGLDYPWSKKRWRTSVSSICSRSSTPNSINGF